MTRRRALRRPSSNKKEYCAVDFDTSYDKKKSLEKTIKDEEAAIAHVTEAIATLKDEIAALIASTSAQGKAVAEATEQRNAEHDAYEETRATDTAAKEVLKYAENILNKFYNRKLYVAPSKVRAISRTFHCHRHGWNPGTNCSTCRHCRDRHHHLMRS